MTLAGGILAGAAFMAAGAAHAADIDVESAWARASAGPAANGAAYVTLVNHGSATALVAVETDVARRAELHTHIMDGDLMKMRPVAMVDLPAGERVVFKPGGLHVMLMGLIAPLREGDSFSLVLRLADGDARTAEVAIGSAAAAEAPEHAQRHGH